MDEKSPYSIMISEDVANNGYGILASKYADVIRKTEITYRLNIDKAAITYYDSLGLVVCEAKGNPNDFPIIGTKKIIDRKADYQKDYDKKNTSVYSLKLTKKDQDVVDFLNSLPNKQDYIRQAIREKMERDSKGGRK